MSKSKARLGFALLLIATMTLTSVGSAIGAPASQPLTTAQEAQFEGGSCDFAGGFAVGLGIATAFGCFVCGIAAAGIAAGTYIACAK